MIGYCPLEDITPQVKTQPIVVENTQKVNKEDTECNYLVMFFIVGVLFMAVTDNMRK
jgi:hypothetical protein